MKSKNILVKILRLSCLGYLCSLSLSCSRVAVYPQPRIPVSTVDTLDDIPLKTHNSTAMLSLEAPLRCNIDTDKIQLIKSVSYEDNLFVLKRTDEKDNIPRYEVTGFSFEKAEASKALSILVKELNIRVIAKDDPYLEMSAEGLKGELPDIVNTITDAADIFYVYDDKHKVLELKKVAPFNLQIPHNDYVILAILDAMRGAGMQNITVDWEDKAILFDADKKMMRKVEKIINSFEGEPLMLALDTSVYRFYPNWGPKEVAWQEMLRVFDRKDIKMTIEGVMGKMLVTSPEINHRTLLNFMNSYGIATKLSEGVFVVPDQWKSRFDVGRCGRVDTGEADLSILAESKISPDKRIETNITLDTSGGEITRFNPKHRLGENYLIIGIPTKLVDPDDYHAEIVILMTPRLIKLVKKEPIALPEEKQEDWSGDWLMNLMNK
ncbi:MAG: hypothetical protein AB7U85_00055 [Alphaproteobacteria bacterium]